MKLTDKIWKPFYAILDDLEKKYGKEKLEQMEEVVFMDGENLAIDAFKKAFKKLEREEKKNG